MAERILDSSRADWRKMFAWGFSCLVLTALGIGLLMEGFERLERQGKGALSGRFPGGAGEALAAVMKTLGSVELEAFAAGTRQAALLGKLLEEQGEEPPPAFPLPGWSRSLWLGRAASLPKSREESEAAEQSALPFGAEVLESVARAWRRASVETQRGKLGGAARWLEKALLPYDWGPLSHEARALREEARLFLGQLYLSQAEATRAELLERIAGFSASLPAAGPAGREAGRGAAAVGQERTLDLHDKGLAALAAGDVLLLERLASRLGAESLDREAALCLEHLDARAALKKGRWGVAVELFEGLLGEEPLPPALERETLGKELEAAALCLGTCRQGLELASRAGEQFRAVLAAGGGSLPRTWRAEAGEWCAEAAARSFLGQPTPQEEVEQLRTLAAGLARVQAIPRTVLEARMDLAAWAAAASIDAEARGEIDEAVAVAEALQSLMGSTPGGRGQVALIVLRSSRLLERRGREGLSRGEPGADADLREAARRRVSLARALVARGSPALGPAPLPGGPWLEGEHLQLQAARLQEEAAGLFELAGEPKLVIAFLSTLDGPLGIQARLTLCRAHLALGNCLQAWRTLDHLLEGDALGPHSPRALGPVQEEARLLRGMARLELVLQGEPLGRASRQAASDEPAAARDLTFLIENTTPASDICRAALFGRALELEHEALVLAEEGGEGAGLGGGATPLLEGARAHLQRLLASGAATEPRQPGEPRRVPSWVIATRAWLARIEERLGRPASATRHLSALAEIDLDDVSLESSAIVPRLTLARPAVEEMLVTAAYHRADLLLHQGDVAGAVEAYESALRRYGDSVLAPWGLLRLAEALRLEGDGRRIEECLLLARLHLDRNGGKAAQGKNEVEKATLARWQRACKAWLSVLAQAEAQ